ncbi:MAG: S8 family peptidase, partial [Candidatus Woesearchaeota archaeon]
MKLKDYEYKLHKLREERERFLELVHSLDKRAERGEVTKYQKQFTISSITHGLQEHEYLRTLEREIQEHEKIVNEGRKQNPATKNLLIISGGITLVLILLGILIIPEISKLGRQNIREFSIPVNATFYEDQTIYPHIYENTTIKSMKLSGAYYGNVQIYFIVNNTGERYLLFDSRKHDKDVVSITGNIFVIRGTPGIEGTELDAVCDETCKIEIDSTNVYILVDIGEGGAIRIDNITYTQVLYNTLPVQVKDITDINITELNKTISLKGYFTDKENDTLRYTLSNIPGVKISVMEDTITFHVKENVRMNQTGFIYVSDGEDRINSNTFKISINTKDIQLQKPSKENETSEYNRTEDGLPLVKTGQNASVESGLKNETKEISPENLTDSNRTINITEETESEDFIFVQGSEKEFNFKIDKRIVDVWMESKGAARPRMIVQYKDGRAVSTDEYLDELYEEMFKEASDSPDDYNMAKLRAEQKELSDNIALMTASVTADAAYTGYNLLTGNVVYDAQETYSEEDIAKAKAELKAISEKIAKAETYYKLKRSKDLESFGYYDKAGIEVLKANFSELRLLRYSNNIDKVYLDDDVDTLITESMNIIRIPQAKLYGGNLLDGSNITICMLDTGVNPEFVRNTFTGYNFVNDNTEYTDDNGHGTAIGYIIYSMVPQSRLIVGKVLDASGKGYESMVIAGLQYCVEQNASIISLSIGSGGYNGYCDDNPLASYVTELYISGKLIVAATGNDANELVKVPA